MYIFPTVSFVNNYDGLGKGIVEEYTYMSIIILSPCDLIVTAVNQYHYILCIQCTQDILFYALFRLGMTLTEEQISNLSKNKDVIVKVKSQKKIFAIKQKKIDRKHADCPKINNYLYYFLIVQLRCFIIKMPLTTHYNILLTFREFT